jgi:hypothetical protein
VENLFPQRRTLEKKKEKKNPNKSNKIHHYIPIQINISHKRKHKHNNSTAQIAAQQNLNSVILPFIDHGQVKKSGKEKKSLLMKPDHQAMNSQ